MHLLLYGLINAFVVLLTDKCIVFILAASLSMPALGIPGTMGAIVAAAALANQQQQQQQQLNQQQSQLGIAQHAFNTPASLSQQSLANSALTNTSTSSLTNLGNLGGLAAAQNTAAGEPH